MSEVGLSTTVVTVVSDRHDHLRAQRRGLLAGAVVPELHVVVSLGDPGVAAVLAELPDLPTVEVTLARPDARLALAAARNAGAQAAIAVGAELLVMLDVDCIPAPDLVAGYVAAARTTAGLLAGTVTYLPPTPQGGWTPAGLAAAYAPHAARPVPAPGATLPGEHTLFWSLSFAVTAADWQRIGGFCTDYAGYGGEDTDFAMKAKARRIPLTWVAGADAYHQHHPVSRPPVEHRDDILRNGAVFARRWGWWPMAGWLDDFERLGLARRTPWGWDAGMSLRVAESPAQHPYVTAVRPAGAVAVHAGRQQGWDPDPLLDPETLARLAPGLDLVHLHFGYDHLSVVELLAWIAALRRHRLPLVLTVHDLRNPHHATRGLHEAQLAVLTAAADAVLTLTPAAARQLEAEYGVVAEVVPHPTLSGEHDLATDSGLVLLHLKSVRRNVCEPGQVAAAAAHGVSRAGGRLLVGLHRDLAGGPEHAELLAAQAEAPFELWLHDRLNDDELHRLVGRAHALVLPYRFGTHSGLLELCRDLGTRVIAPDCGAYGGPDGQWPEVVGYRNDEDSGLDAASLGSAVESALRRPPPVPADRAVRLAERERVRLVHQRVYERVIQSRVVRP